MYVFAMSVSVCISQNVCVCVCFRVSLFLFPFSELGEKVKLWRSFCTFGVPRVSLLIFQLGEILKGGGEFKFFVRGFPPPPRKKHKNTGLWVSRCFSPEKHSRKFCTNAFDNYLKCPWHFWNLFKLPVTSGRDNFEKYDPWHFRLSVALVKKVPVTRKNSRDQKMSRRQKH